MRTPTLNFLALTILMLIFSINNKTAAHLSYLNNCAKVLITSADHEPFGKIENSSSRDTTVIICDDEIPFVWNGNSYYTTGIYIDTLTNSQGNDSIVTLNLTVNFTHYGSTNVTICDICVPYIWNGNGYSSPGTYVDTLQTYLGCDSIVTLHLIIHNLAYTNVFAQVNPTSLPYMWHGNSYWNTGIYHDTLKTYLGCDSIVTLYLAVGPTPNTISTVEVCESVLPIIHYGDTITSSGCYYDTLVNQTGGDSILLLYLVVEQTPFITNLTGATTVHELHTENYTVDKTKPCSYFWKISNGKIINGQGTNSVSVQWINPGQGNVKVIKELKGCKDSSNINVVIQTATGIIEGQKDIPALLIYPNPTSNILNLEFQSPEASIVDIAIYDSFGRLILVEKDKKLFSGSSTTTFNVANWSKGIYFIRVLGQNNWIETKRVLVL